MIWYIYTAAIYVLVEAENETEARQKALPELQQLRLERTPEYAYLPIVIWGARPATADEIDLSKPF